MRKLLTPSIRGFFAAVGILSWAAVASAQGGGAGNPPFDPTHYWTYQNLGSFYFPQPIEVADQFYPQPIPVTADLQIRLLNWVHKNGSLVPDTLLHYSWWNIHEKLLTPRLVKVSNQFGTYDVQVHNLEFLLTPASKNNPLSNELGANHYLCYRATGFPGPPFPVELLDEWRHDYQPVQDMQFLCTPCLKIHDGYFYPPVDTVTHFAVYPITPTSDFFQPYVVDQFYSQLERVKQIPYEYLFVPSEKSEHPTPTKRSTWGRIKNFYR